MFESVKELFITYFASQNAAFFSAVLQGIAAAGAAIYGIFSFSKWTKEKYYEKRSDYAENSLNYLDTAHENLVEILTKNNIPDWDKRFAKSKMELGHARRKARRLGDDTINSLYIRYDDVVKAIELNHAKKMDDLFSSKEKTEAIEELSHAVDRLKKLYRQIYEELVSKSLINYH